MSEQDQNSRESLGKGAATCKAEYRVNSRESRVGSRVKFNRKANIRAYSYTTYSNSEVTIRPHLDSSMQSISQFRPHGSCRKSVCHCLKLICEFILQHLSTPGETKSCCVFNASELTGATLVCTCF